MQSPGHSKRGKKRILHKMRIVKKKKKDLNQISSVSLSLSITLSPCALLNPIKESRSAGRRGVREVGGLGRSRGRRGRMVRAKISISDFHILNTLIYLTLGLFKVGREERKRWEALEEKGRGHL